MEFPTTPVAPSSTAPPHPVEPKIEYSLTDKILGLSAVVLAGLEAAAGYIPVPFVADAVGFAAKLVKMVNDIKKNIGICKDLAYNACCITYCAFRKCEDLVAKKGTDSEGHCSISAELRDQLQQLMITLANILQECEKICSRNLAGRLFFKSKDESVVGRLSRRLDSAMVLFNFQSVMDMQEAVGKCAKSDSRQKKVAQAATINSTGNSNNNIITIAGDNSRVYTNAGTYNTVNYNYHSEPPRIVGSPTGHTAGLDQLTLVNQVSRLVEGNPTLRGFLAS